jgi:hypothetical protein
MINIIPKTLDEINDRTGLNHDTVRYCLERAIEEAVCKFFDLQECDVDLDNQTVIPVFHVPYNMDIEEGELFSKDTVYHDLICPEFTFEMFHEDIIADCREFFKRNIIELEADELEKKWRKKVHQVVEGVIGYVYRDYTEIKLGDNAEGRMLKLEWVPKEVPMYRDGKLFQFYVTKVVRKNAAVIVHLSRGSKNFPAALLKEKVPWANIKVIKRIRGKKTWLKSNCPINHEIISELRRELKGEVIEVINI